jgi:hypothetical protein
MKFLKERDHLEEVQVDGRRELEALEKTDGLISFDTTRTAQKRTRPTVGDGAELHDSQSHEIVKYGGRNQE